MTAAVVDFERILASEGLAPIDKPLARRQVPKLTDAPTGRIIRQDIATRVHSPEQAAAADAYLGWAREILRTHRFGGRRQKSVWKLYAEGLTLTAIVRRLRVSRRSVTRAIERVARAAPPAPVPNPWRKSQRVVRTNDNQFVAMLRELLEERKENEMAEAKRLHYDLIMLKGGHNVEIPRPRIGARNRDRFLNIEGRPHAGGIDVEVETKDTTGRNTITTITVPWDIIAHAHRQELDTEDETATGGRRTERAAAAE